MNTVSPASPAEISFEVDDKIASTAHWIVDYFENQVQAGVRFESEQTVQIGWMHVLLRLGTRCLEVWEPDFDAMPIRWCRGVNNTLRHLTLQRSICEMMKCDPVFPTIMHVGVVSPCFFSSDACTMSRDEVVGSDSGWVFAERGYCGKEGEFVSLYQVALQKISVVPFLALPETAFIRIQRGQIEVTVGSVVASSQSNALLSQLGTEPILV